MGRRRTYSYLNPKSGNVIWNDLFYTSYDYNTKTVSRYGGATGWFNWAIGEEYHITGSNSIEYEVFCPSIEKTDGHFLGLSYASTLSIYQNNSYTGVPFSIYWTGGILGVFEWGSQKYSGSLSGVIKVSIRVNNGKIEYLKDNIVFYTSAIVPSGIIHPYVSLYYMPNTIQNIQITVN